jgi:hypothetical protein
MIVLNEMQRSPEQIAALEALARRVAGAPQLHGSPKLREFFLYVVDCALREVPDEATEQHIGVHVFHRSPGYNSGDDSIVRSQARLLRAKLTAYFAAEGAHEPIVIEIPKGQYLPIFRAASEHADPIHSTLHEPAPPAYAAAPTIAAASHPAEHLAPQTETPVTPARTHWLRIVALGVFVALLCGGLAGFFLRGRIDHPPTPILDAFWRPFYASENALVIYSNPAFTGDPSTGLRLLPQYSDDDHSVADAGDSVDETYTGTGEAAAIHNLTQLFDAHGASFTLKRSRLVTWDEARTRSLVFIGAPSQNVALNDLQTLTQFRITMAGDHHGYILNAHPRSGEPATFPVQTPNEETAIVALLAGLQPNTRIAIFSGLSTIGTQEAVEFFCQPDALKTLIAQVGTDRNGTLKPFEAVLQIRKSKGVAMGASFLAIHSR